MTVEGRIFKDSAQSLLHRLPNTDEQTPCGLWDVGLNNQISQDSTTFAWTPKCLKCFSGQDFTDGHTEHCCKRHGCKYATNPATCTVTRGVRKQSHPCEWCAHEEDEMEEAGEVWQYAVRFGADESTLRELADESAADRWVKQFTTWTKVRRRLSQWEEA